MTPLYTFTFVKRSKSVYNPLTAVADVIHPIGLLEPTRNQGQEEHGRG